MEKTYVFDNGSEGCGMNGLIAALCNKQGIDPGYLLAMMNNGGFGGNGGWIWILVLLIFGWNGFGGNGFGGRGNAQGIADAVQLLNGNDGRELLLQAINGNGNAIAQLSTKLGCDYNALSGAIQNLSTQLCTLGGQIGLGQKDIVAAITNGKQSILSKLCDCCCSTQRQIADFRGDIALQMCQQTGTIANGQRDITAAVTKGFCDSAYATREQTCELKNAMNEGFARIEYREQQREINQLREQNQQLALAASQAAQTQAIISQLQPVAKPAYITCSPYQSAYGYPFAGYPYGYNGGCGCNCNNGCNNNGCGCC